MVVSRELLAKLIDSTMVKATATRSEVEKLCREAVQYGFRCVIVNPVYVRLAASRLRGTDVKVGSTVGFPFGVSLSDIKALEAVKAVEDGACELDMVMNLSAFKSGDYDLVKRDIEAVVAVKRLYSDIIVKVIIETPLLTNEEKVAACKIVKEVGADFVKTSTGLFGKGVTVEDVKLMRQVVGKDFGVKAAGGIRTYTDAIAMIEAGANRIGTSAATAIIQGAP
ncbi:MAG: deoxyribose-phosphate aldolase [Candidatus Bathyarchaeia archaeon]|nr:deoxyribose-phosphate aldolase [Candidatus Bathyarchaeota archaeon]